MELHAIGIDLGKTVFHLAGLNSSGNVIVRKRGNSYPRRLFVQGARVVMQYRTKQAPGLSCWLSQLMARTHQNVAVVALANKLLRLAARALGPSSTMSPDRVSGPRELLITTSQGGFTKISATL
jgi:hypothetical protein